MKSPEPGDAPQDEASPAVRAVHLLAEARAAAFEHTRLVDAALRDMIARAREVAEGGDVYPGPVRDLCDRLAEEVDHRRQLLELLSSRSLDPAGPARFGLDGT